MNQPTRNANKFKYLGIIALVFLLFFLFVFIYIRSISSVPQQNADYQCIFLSMYPIEAFDEDDFGYYRALPAVKITDCFETLEELSAFFEASLTDTPSITHIYLGLDPDKIGKTYDYQTDQYIKAMEKYLLPWITGYPKITFEILLPFDSLEKWQGLTEKETTASFQAYRAIFPLLSDQPNVIAYYLGSEEWLIANPANYEEYNQCPPDISKTILLYTFQDDTYQVTNENMEGKLSLLENLITQEIPSFSDYTNLTMVFFGDSIIGNYTGSLSIPGVVNAFTKARVYNCGYGGISAALNEESLISFPVIVSALTQGDLSLIPQEVQAHQGIQEFRQAEHEQICFVINYGLNDYFGGFPVYTEDPYDISSYCGALRLGISELQEAYPDAIIILMTPTYCTYFSEGTEKQGEYGGILTEYVAAILNLSDELSVYSINNYADLGFNILNQKQYLEDGCHLNEWGRYLLGRNIIGKLEEIFAE